MQSKFNIDKMQKAKLLLLGTCLTLGMAATAQKIAIQLPASEAGVTSLAAQQYSVAISDAKGDISLKFSTISSSADKQRAYLDEFIDNFFNIYSTFASR